MRLKHFRLDIGAQIFLACSDRSRLRVLSLIQDKGEMCITDLERVLDFTQSKTSRHLLYLKNSGILAVRKINQWTFYSIKEEVQDLVRVLLGFVERDPELIRDREICETMNNNRDLPGLQLAARNQPRKYG